MRCAAAWCRFVDRRTRYGTRLSRSTGQRFFSTVDPQSEEEQPTKVKKKDQLGQLLSLYRPETRSVAVSSLALAVSTAITMTVPASMGMIVDMTTSSSTSAVTIDALNMKLGALFLTGAGETR